MCCQCLRSIFHLSYGELSPARVILYCSRPRLCSVRCKGGGSSSTRQASWWHYSLSGNGRVKATTSRGLIAEPALRLPWLIPRLWLLSALQTPLVKHGLRWVLPWRSLWSWWTTAWAASVPPLLQTAKIDHFHPPAHLLARSGQQDPSSPRPGNTNMKTCSVLNQTLSFDWDFHSAVSFMFTFLPQSRQGVPF